MNNTDDSKIIHRILNEKDYYKIMGVTKDSETKHIKRQFRKLAMKVHPDHCKSTEANECFAKLQSVYECLCDPDSRAFYDTNAVDPSEYANLHQNEPSMSKEEFEHLKSEFLSEHYVDEKIFSDYIEKLKKKGKIQRKKQFKTKKYKDDKVIREERKKVEDEGKKKHGKKFRVGRDKDGKKLPNFRYEYEYKRYMRGKEKTKVGKKKRMEKDGIDLEDVEIDDGEWNVPLKPKKEEKKTSKPKVPKQNRKRQFKKTNNDINIMEEVEEILLLQNEKIAKKENKSKKKNEKKGVDYLLKKKIKDRNDRIREQKRQKRVKNDFARFLNSVKSSGDIDKGIQRLNNRIKESEYERMLMDRAVEERDKIREGERVRKGVAVSKNVVKKLYGDRKVRKELILRKESNNAHYNYIFREKMRKEYRNSQKAKALKDKPESECRELVLADENSDGSKKWKQVKKKKKGKQKNRAKNNKMKVRKMVIVEEEEEPSSTNVWDVRKKKIQNGKSVKNSKKLGVSKKSKQKNGPSKNVSPKKNTNPRSPVNAKSGKKNAPNGRTQTKKVTPKKKNSPKSKSKSKNLKVSPNGKTKTPAKGQVKARAKPKAVQAENSKEKERMCLKCGKFFGYNNGYCSVCVGKVKIVDEGKHQKKYKELEKQELELKLLEQKLKEQKESIERKRTELEKQAREERTRKKLAKLEEERKRKEEEEKRKKEEDEIRFMLEEAHRRREEEEKKTKKELKLEQKRKKEEKERKRREEEERKIEEERRRIEEEELLQLLQAEREAEERRQKRKNSKSSNWKNIQEEQLKLISNLGNDDAIEQHLLRLTMEKEKTLSEHSELSSPETSFETSSSGSPSSEEDEEDDDHKRWLEEMYNAYEQDIEDGARNSDEFFNDLSSMVKDHRENYQVLPQFDKERKILYVFDEDGCLNEFNLKKDSTLIVLKGTIARELSCDVDAIKKITVNNVVIKNDRSAKNLKEGARLRVVFRY